MEIKDNFTILTKEEHQLLLSTNDELRKQNARLEAQVIKLEARIKKLEARLHKNSGNSYKAPSSDVYNKKFINNNNKEKSPLKPGSQPGHQGSTLRMVDKPDKIVKHQVEGKC
jgi:transposase